MKNEKRVKTGIPGLDLAIHGGLIPGSVTLLCGGTGAGKTIMGMQYIYNGARKYGERGLFISSQDKETKLIRYAKTIGMDFAPLIKRKKVFIKTIKPTQPKILMKLTAPLVSGDKVKRLVIDSATIVEYYLKDIFSVRNIFYDLFSQIRGLGVTSIFVSEAAKEEFSQSGIEFLADTVILLRKGGKATSQIARGIEIIKMRESTHSKIIHPYIISNKGVTVFSKEKFLV